MTDRLESRFASEFAFNFCVVTLQLWDELGVRLNVGRHYELPATAFCTRVANCSCINLTDY